MDIEFKSKKAPKTKKNSWANIVEQTISPKKGGVDALSAATILKPKDYKAPRQEPVQDTAKPESKTPANDTQVMEDTVAKQPEVDAISGAQPASEHTRTVTTNPIDENAVMEETIDAMSGAQPASTKEQLYKDSAKMAWGDYKASKEFKAPAPVQQEASAAEQEAAWLSTQPKHIQAGYAFDKAYKAYGEIENSKPYKDLMSKIAQAEEVGDTYAANEYYEQAQALKDDAFKNAQALWTNMKREEQNDRVADLIGLDMEADENVKAWIAANDRLQKAEAGAADARDRSTQFLTGNLIRAGYREEDIPALIASGEFDDEMEYDPSEFLADAEAAKAELAEIEKLLTPEQLKALTTHTQDDIEYADALKTKKELEAQTESAPEAGVDVTGLTQLAYDYSNPNVYDYQYLLGFYARANGIDVFQAVGDAARAADENWNANDLHVYREDELAQYMEPEEVAALNKIVAYGTPEQALEYYEALTTDLRWRAITQQEINDHEFATNHPLLATAREVSLPVQIAKAAEFVGEALGTINGSTRVEIRYGARNTRRYSTAIGTVSQNILMKNQESFTFAGREFTYGEMINFLFQDGISMIESGQRMFLGPFGLAIGGMDAGSATYLSAMDRDLSTWQAVGLSCIATAAEVVTEKVSLDALFSHKTGANFWRSVGEVLKQAVTEGFEEVASDILNDIGDWLIAGGDNTELTAAAKQLFDEAAAKQAPISMNEAYWRAALAGYAESFLGGAVSGLGFGTIEEIVNVNRKGGYKAIRDARQFYAITPEQHKQYTQDIIKAGYSPEVQQFMIDMMDQLAEDPSDVLLTNEGREQLAFASELMAANADVTAQTAFDAYDTELEGIREQENEEVDNAIREAEIDDALVEAENPGATEEAINAARETVKENAAVILEKVHEMANAKVLEATERAKAEIEKAQNQRKIADAFGEFSKKATAALESGDLNAHAEIMNKMRSALGDLQAAKELEAQEKKAQAVMDEQAAQKADDEIMTVAETAAQNIQAANAEAQAVVDTELANADNVIKTAQEKQDGEIYVLDSERGRNDGEVRVGDRTRDVQQGESRTGETEYYTRAGSGVERNVQEAERKDGAPQTEKRIIKEYDAVRRQALSDFTESAKKDFGDFSVREVSPTEVNDAYDHAARSLQAIFGGSGISLFDYTKKNGMTPYGFADKGRGLSFVQYTGKWTDFFHAGHENAHHMQGLQNAILNSAVADDAIAAYLNMKGLQDNAHNREEFACDIAGAFAINYVFGNTDYNNAVIEALGITHEQFEELMNTVADGLMADPMDMDGENMNDNGFTVTPKVRTVSEAKNSSEVLNAVGIEVTENGAVMYSRAYVPTTEEDILKTIDALVEKTGVPYSQAQKWVEGEISISKLVAESKHMDYDPDDRFDAIKNNSDYPSGTVDLNNNCVKRKIFTKVFDMLQREMPDRAFNAIELEKIRKLIGEAGYPAACAGCFVEERRKALGAIAQDFIKAMMDGVKQKNPNRQAALNLFKAGDGYIPSIPELITYDGFRKLYEEHRGTHDAFIRWNNSRGMQAGRLVEGRAEYKREVLNWTDDHVKKVNSLGGLRIFSFSDFEGMSMLDIMQIIQDCARKGVKMHGYTKVADFARFAYETGLKLNCSHIPPKEGAGFHYDDNGHAVLDFDKYESFPDNDPSMKVDGRDIRETSRTIGNNVIGVNDDQIRVAMADPNIHQIIGFHTSDSKKVQKEKGTGNWTNYKKEQNEIVKEGYTGGGTHYQFRETNRKTWHRAKENINFYTEVIDRAANEGHPIQNAKDFQEMFFKVCDEKGLIPRFFRFADRDENGKFVYTPGYEKFLVDFPMFDNRTGEFWEQEAVRPEFNPQFTESILTKAEADEEKIYTQEEQRKMRAIVDKVKTNVLGIKDAASVQDEMVNGGVAYSTTRISREEREVQKARDEIAGLGKKIIDRVFPRTDGIRFDRNSADYGRAVQFANRIANELSNGNMEVLDADSELLKGLTDNLMDAAIVEIDTTGQVDSTIADSGIGKQIRSARISAMRRVPGTGMYEKAFGGETMAELKKQYPYLHFVAQAPNAETGVVGLDQFYNDIKGSLNIAGSENEGNVVENMIMQDYGVDSENATWDSAAEILNGIYRDYFSREAKGRKHEEKRGRQAVNELYESSIGTDYVAKVIGDLINDEHGIAFEKILSAPTETETDISPIDDIVNEESFAAPEYAPDATGAKLYDKMMAAAERPTQEQAAKEERSGYREDMNARSRNNAIRQAEFLYNSKKTVKDYYDAVKDKQIKGLKTRYDKRVANHLRGMLLRNGQNVGGLLNNKTMNELNEHMVQNQQFAQNRLSFMSPYRVFDKVYSPYQNDTVEHIKENRRIAGAVTDATVEFGLQQNAARALWESDAGERAAEWFDKTGTEVAIATQMLGEGVINEEQMSQALYGNGYFMTNAIDGTILCGREGKILAISDSTGTKIVDKNLKQKIAKMIPEVAAGLKAEKNEKADRRAVERLRAGLGDGEPISIDTTMLIDFNGEKAVCRIGDTVIAEITNGTHVDGVRTTENTTSMREWYNKAWDDQNRVLTDNGYAPMGYVASYFPHPRQGQVTETTVSDLLKGFLEEDALPTAINGMTSEFKPGHPWAAHLLANHGEVKQFNAATSFNKYVKAAGMVLYNTPVVQRMRQFESYTRANSPDNKNSALVAWLREYGNHWANKKSDLDRPVERLLGRTYYTVSSALTRFMGQSAVAGSFSSALSNFISELTAIPDLDKREFAKQSIKTIPQLLEYLRNGDDKDGLTDKIHFLAARHKAYDAIITNKRNRAVNKYVEIASTFFTASDFYTSEVVARTKYAECLKKGMTEAEAIKATDKFCIENFADRGTGMMPSVFNAKAIRPIMQFGLETLNQLSHASDMHGRTLDSIVERYDREIEKYIDENGTLAGIDLAAIEKQVRGYGNRKDIAKGLMYSILLSMWGGFTRALLRRDQTWNPIGMGYDFYQDVQKDGVGTAMSNLKDSVLEQTPVVGSLMGGGRIPISTIFDNAGDAAQALQEGLKNGIDASTLERIGVFFSNFPPTGGQIRKTVQGVSTVAKGGSYTKKGELRYPVEQTAGNYIKGALFGKGALQPAGYDYKTGKLSAKKTESYEELVDSGVNKTDAYEAVKNYTDSDASLYLNMVSGGMDRKDAKGFADKYVAERPASNAEKAFSVLTYDKNGDGTPDLDEREQALILATLTPKYDPEKNGSISDYAISQAKDYLKKKKKDLDKGQISESEYEEKYNIFEEYFNLLGLDTGVLPQ